MNPLTPTLLLLTSYQDAMAFAPSPLGPVVRPPYRTLPLTSLPIRKSGSLFGLNDFKSQDPKPVVASSAIGRVDTSQENAGSHSNHDKKNQRNDVVKASDDSNNIVTILRKSDREDVSYWNGVDFMERDYDDVDTLDDVDAIADSLLLPPTVVALKDYEESQEITVKKDLESGDERIKREGTDSAESTRDRIKREAAERLNKAFADAETDDTKIAHAIPNAIDLNVAEEHHESNVQEREFLTADNRNPTVAKDGEGGVLVEKRLLSPTRPIRQPVSSPLHSIRDDAEVLNHGTSADAVVADASIDDYKELNQTKLSMEKDTDAVEGLGANATGLVEDELKEQAIINENSIVPQEDTTTTTKPMEPKVPKSDDNTNTPSPLETILSTATSFLSPKPPLTPPSVRSIINSDTATSNLEEINAQLSQTSKNQREDLGRLRRKVNELERQLIRAKRDKIDQIEDDVNARVDTIRKECERNVIEANEAVVRLEEEVNRLKLDLDASSKNLMENEEAKERVAAEYGFVVKAYTDVKHALDSQKVEWDEQVKLLEDQLADATEQIKRYQKEAKQWKDECANKANQLQSSTSQMTQMQTTIDELQSSIKLKEQEIKDLVRSEAKEMERKLSSAKRQLRDEYEELLRKKSKKIGELRMALRSANEKRKRVESVAQRDTAEALNEMHTEMTVEIDRLKAVLVERETKLFELKEKAEEAEGIVEDKERLLAEMMFLAKSVETLQANLTSTTQQCSDLLQENTDKSDEIEGLVQVSNANLAKVSLLESEVDSLSDNLKKQKSLNAGYEMELNDLVADLEKAEKHVNKLNEQIDLFRQESKAYEATVGDLQAHISQLESDKILLQQNLADERDGFMSAIDDKVTSIGILEQELAEKINEIDTMHEKMSKVESRLEDLSNQHALEKKRADDLKANIREMKQNVTTTPQPSDISESDDDPLEVYERKISALTQQNILSQQLLYTKLEELANLKDVLNEMQATSAPANSIAEESSEPAAELQAEMERISAALRQYKAQAREKLLAKDQTLTEKQQEIESLSVQVKELEMAVKTKDESTMNDLNTKLENVQNEFSIWRAKANEKILNADNLLKSKEDRILQLQNNIEAMVKNQTEALKTTSESKEESSKVKEKLRLKNQVIKERDDAINELSIQLNDLQFEKGKVEQALEKEKQRNEDFFRSHEMQIKATEDKLSRKHATNLKQLEDEKNKIVYNLEMEIKSLKRKVADGMMTPPSSLETGAHASESLRMQELQAALRQSKKKEVELINRNMMMKNQIENLEAQKKLLVMSASDADARRDRQAATAVELPSYYKEGKRARLKRVIGNVWKKLLRR